MLLDSKMQDLGCHYLQFDELWRFIGKKERHLRVDDNPALRDARASDAGIQQETGKLEAAVALHFAYYNFVKRHNTLRYTPAMAAGVERDFWAVADLLEAVA
jgi:hypothetical protein